MDKERMIRISLMRILKARKVFLISIFPNDFNDTIEFWFIDYDVNTDQRLSKFVIESKDVANFCNHLYEILLLEPPEIFYMDEVLEDLRGEAIPRNLINIKPRIYEFIWKELLL